MIKDKKLPNKLSALIRMALVDLGKVERNKQYKVDMTVWHQPRTTSRGTFCFVCLAGAVIAKEFNVNPNASVDPLEVPDKEMSDRLYALEYTRLGDVPAAVYTFTKNVLAYDRAVERSGKLPTFPSYRKDKARFKRGMRKLASWLEGNGL